MELTLLFANVRLCHNKPTLFILIGVSSAGESYQNMDPNQGYQGSSSQSVSRDFWETFGSSSSLKAKKSPSSDSWTVADNSAKKSSDSWDNWGSEAASNKHSTEESWEAWDNNWENADGKSKKSPTKAAEESWNNAEWWPHNHTSPLSGLLSVSVCLLVSLALWGASSAKFPSAHPNDSIIKLTFWEWNDVNWSWITFIPIDPNLSVYIGSECAQMW